MKKTLLGVVILATLLSGCPKEKRALEVSRKTVELTAQVVVTVDREVATLYAEAAQEALAACETRLCYNGKMENWDKTAKAVAGAQASLKALDTALDVWESGSPNGQQNFLRAAGCLFDTLLHVSSLLDVVGVDVPNLGIAIDLGRNLLGSTGITCER